MKTQKPFLLGCSDFDEIIEEDTFFIDKTMFIKEFMQYGSKVTCILRPRRFGKSTNLSMLKSFLSLGSQPESYSRYLIGKETDFVAEHCGQYPVINLNLKDCKGATWDEMYRDIWLCIRMMVGEHQDDLAHIDLSSFQLGLPSNEVITPLGIFDTLQWLIKSLYKKHKKEVIVLIDEYDAPLNHAVIKGYYEEASAFFGKFYSSALKQDGNAYLEKACLMGIVEVKGAGILSGLNNIDVYCTSDEYYSSSFGFLLPEITKFVSADLREGVIDWYNGYTFGSETVINPWSFMNYLKRRKLSSYWVDTSYTETLSVFLSPHAKATITSVLDLICCGAIDVTPLKPQVNYTAQIWDINSILHFLVHTGYLTYKLNPVTQRYQVSIPNKELEEHWKTEFIPLAKYFMTELNPQFPENIKNCLTEFNYADLEKIMKEMVNYCSSFDLTSENSYHMFFYGCFFAVLNGNNNIIVSSNKEAGLGRYDIRIEFRDIKKAVVFEFKKSRTKEQLEKDAKEGLNQCQRNDYGADLRDYKCLLIGVSFFKKEMSKLCTHQQ